MLLGILLFFFIKQRNHTLNTNRSRCLVFFSSLFIEKNRIIKSALGRLVVYAYVARALRLNGGFTVKTQTDHTVIIVLGLDRAKLIKYLMVEINAAKITQRYRYNCKGKR